MAGRIVRNIGCESKPPTPHCETTRLHALRTGVAPAQLTLAILAGAIMPLSAHAAVKPASAPAVKPNAAFDAWSDGVLRSELSALYAAYRRGELCSLPEPALQFADYAVWQREWLTGDVLQRELDHWRAELENAPLTTSYLMKKHRPLRSCGSACTS